MFRPRCFLTDPQDPGSLQLITLKLQSNCAPFMEACMRRAADKWQRLFTLRIVTYSLSNMGAVLLLYVPNKLLSPEEANQRNEEFDLWLDTQRSGKPRGRRHHLTAEQLRSPSHFFAVFNPDLRRLHKSLPPPADLPPGFSHFPVYKERYGAKTVQPEALPPIFTGPQMAQIGKELKALGFCLDAAYSPLGDLYLSPHGIGTLEFVADLEDRCWDYLSSIQKAPILWKRFGDKYIVPLDEKTWERRLKEFVLKEAHEDYPRIWSLLMGLDILSDDLLSPQFFGDRYKLSGPHQEYTVLACLPISITLLLADGMLRWYYKSRKHVEFPHYNFYRRLQPWEVPEHRIF